MNMIKTMTYLGEHDDVFLLYCPHCKSEVEVKLLDVNCPHCNHKMHFPSGVEW